MRKEVTKKEAQIIIDKFAKSLPNTINKGLYIGKQNDIYIYYIKRTVKGNHLGSPMYFGIGVDKKIFQIEDSKLLFYAMNNYKKLYHDK